MVYVSGAIAKDVNDSDKVIKETLENIVEKEKKIIRDYQNLKNFRENAPIEFLDDLDKLLEERKMFLNYKLQSKEKQIEYCKSKGVYSSVEVTKSKYKKKSSCYILKKNENEKLYNEIKKKMIQNIVGVFILPPSKLELYERLNKRKSNKSEKEYRFRKLKTDIDHCWKYNYIIVNNSMITSIERLLSILSVEIIKEYKLCHLNNFLSQFLIE